MEVLTVGILVYGFVFGWILTWFDSRRPKVETERGAIDYNTGACIIGLLWPIIVPAHVIHKFVLVPWNNRMGDILDVLLK